MCPTSRRRSELQKGLQTFMSPRLRLVATWVALVVLTMAALEVVYLLLPSSAKALIGPWMPTAAKVVLAFVLKEQFRLVLALLVILAIIYVAWRWRSRHHDIWPLDPADDGIRVGAAKIFDARSLTLMYEELIEQLRTIESIKKDSITSAVGTQQGGTSSNTAVGVGAPAPGAAKDADTPPPAATVPSGVTSNERASDLLRDQMNLAFQAFNLRLTLERSLSDRILDPAAQTTRRQAVIGIPVSIDPPAFAVGCSARVEVRFTIKDAAPSLVGLLPQEQTYNMLGVDTRAWQAKAPLKAAGIGNLQIVSGEAQQALRRQADVVAFEVDPGGQNKLIVAWEFRPGPGERSVSAGLKPVVAVLALPVADDKSPAKVSIESRTSWHAWNADNQISAVPTGWRALFSDRKTRTEWSGLAEVEIPASEVTDDALGPKITKIDWAPVGGDKAAILICGSKFFPGTRVVLGGTSLSKPEDGLTIKSEQAMQVIVPMDSLLREGVLNGRYGQSIQLGQDAGMPPQLTGVTLLPNPARTNYLVTLVIEPRHGVDFPLQRFYDLPWPLLLIGGKRVNELLTFSTPTMVKDPATHQDTKNIKEVKAFAVVPAACLPSLTTVFALHWPFFNNWTPTTYSVDPAVTLNVFRSPLTGGKVRLLFTGSEFHCDKTVIILDKDYANAELVFPDASRKDLIAIEVDESTLKLHTQVFVCQAGRQPVALDVPLRSSPGFSITSISVQKLALNTAAFLEFSGAGLTQIEKATLDQKALDTFASPEGAKILVRFPADSITTAGKKTLIFTGRDGHTAELLIEVA